MNSTVLTTNITSSLFLVCPHCRQRVRQLVKDLNRVAARICPDCGTNIQISEQLRAQVVAE